MDEFTLATQIGSGLDVNTKLNLIQSYGIYRQTRGYKSGYDTAISDLKRINESARNVIIKEFNRQIDMLQDQIARQREKKCCIT